MHAVNLISAAIKNKADCPELPCEPVDGICAVTGKQGPCVPRKLVIPKTNCDQPWFSSPLADTVSVDVYNAWNYGHVKPGAKRASRPERQACWWCDGSTFCTMTRKDIRKIVLQGSPSVPWAMWVTTSYKKHGSLRANVNYQKYGYIAFEERTADCSDTATNHEWWERLNDALKAGIGRSVIESLDCPAHIMRKATLPVWMAFEAWARPRYQSALYAFLAYLLPSKEERDATAK